MTYSWFESDPLRQRLRSVAPHKLIENVKCFVFTPCNKESLSNEQQTIRVEVKMVVVDDPTLSSNGLTNCATFNTMANPSLENPNQSQCINVAFKKLAA